VCNLPENPASDSVVSEEDASGIELVNLDSCSLCDDSTWKLCVCFECKVFHYVPTVRKNSAHCKQNKKRIFKRDCIKVVGYILIDQINLFFML